MHDPKQANALGIEVVYQDLALCDNLDVVHNMFLGREETKGGTLDEIQMEKRATDTLKGLSVRTLKSVRQQVSSLSGGQRQTVAIARAVLWNSRMVILDEPTAALGVAQTEQVLNLVRRLADNGLGVVLISHNMNDVMEVADNMACLYLGRMCAQVPQVRRQPLDDRRADHRPGDPATWACNPRLRQREVWCEHHGADHGRRRCRCGRHRRYRPGGQRLLHAGQGRRRRLAARRPRPDRPRSASSP